MNIAVLFRLLSAHFFADFFLQSEKFCAEKKKLHSVKGWSVQLMHSFIQAAMAYLFAALWDCWQIPAVIFISHLIIDTLKYAFGKDGLLSFSLDQVAHIGVIVGLFAILGGSFEIVLSFDAKFWAIVLSYLVALAPTSTFINVFYRTWSKNRVSSSKDVLKETMDSTVEADENFYKGGTYIGYLERVLALTFILAGCWEGIGFLLAAKSIFRFGDLQNKKDVSRTEYVLVGTLFSFTVPVVIGLIMSKLFVF